MTKRYDQLCVIPSIVEPKVEDIDKPVRDNMQEAWLKFFELLMDRGSPIRGADSPIALRDAYEEDGGLVVKLYNQQVIDDYRQRHGRRRDKDQETVLRAFHSLSQGEYAEMASLLEDADAELPFHIIETDGLFRSTIEGMPDNHRKALVRFAAAWALYDAGVQLPHKIKKQVEYDRKRTGLPLLLQV